MRIVAVIASWFFASAGLACSIPLQATRTAFVTSVTLGPNGPFRFLVDTGSTATVIDRAVADKLGLPRTRTLAAVTATGLLETAETVIAELRAGAVSMTGLAALIAPLPPFPSHGHLDGILGMNFFAGRSILFDADHRCVEVDVAPPARGTTLDAHPIAERVAIEIDGLNLVIDSGASFPVLMSRAARSLAAIESATEMTSAAGMSRAVTANVRVLRIGRRVFHDVAVALAADRDEREDGLLPITMLHRVFIDADRRSVRID